MSRVPVLLDYLDTLGHAVFTSGILNLNIVGIRTASEHSEPNSFDDRMCVVYKDDQGWVSRTWQITTDPGRYWLQHPMNINGTAILCPGQYRGSHVIAKHRGQYDALCQRGGAVKVFRDRNKNTVIDMEPGTMTEGMYGINIHKAGAISERVDRWSAGCQVFSHEADFLAFMALCRKSAEIYGPRFTYTLIDEPRWLHG